MKKIINQIIIVAICITTLIASIIVGTPLKENTKILSIIILAIFLINIFINRKTIKQINKLDICIIILCLCPFIPIIFRTAVSIEDAINVAIRYLSILMVYITTKTLILENKKYKNYIIITIILTGVISAIIGIDNMTFKTFFNQLYNMGVPFVINVEKRMFGNFGYANTFAISLLLPLILSLDKYVNQEKGNIGYIGINFIFVSCILLSYSKATYLVMAVSVILYCIIQKDRKKNIKLLIHLAIAIICGVIYSKIFTTLYQEKNNIGIWITLLEFMLINIAIALLCKKLIKIEKLTIKKCIILVISIIILAVIFIAIGLNMKTPLVMFEKETQTEEVKYKISNIEPNTKYEFKFEVESKALYNRKIYSIQVVEEDEQLQTIIEHEIKLNTYFGEKSIEFETAENTREFALIFKSSDAKKQKGLTINNLEINGEQYVLNYAYLPASVINKIRNFNLNNFSVTGRLKIYKDAINLLKQNPWTGIGGNGWGYQCSYTSQVHSYPLQIFLEFGIISVIIYCIIVIILLKTLRTGKKENFGVWLAIFAILSHSIVDFDLSFMNMLLYTFLLISIISVNIEEKKGRN